MAEVFRPAYYVDPTTNKRVSAGFSGAVRKKSPTWWIRYYTPDGKRHKVKGYRDKKATENKAAELERRGIRLDAGIVDPTEEHAKKPLAEHAEDFRRYLAAKGNTADYVALINFRLTAVLDECGFVRISDVQASAVVEFLARLRQVVKDVPGKSIKTANEYLAAAKGFTRWLWRDKRTSVDALAGLSKLANGETDLRHARRDLSAEELRRLLDATRASTRKKYKLDGIDRHALYLTACATGFRVSELASMTPESFALEGQTPTVAARAACTKNRKEAVQPLPREVASVLRDYLRDKQAGQLVWQGTSWPVHASTLIRRDLAEARNIWLSEAPDGSERTRREQSDFLAYCDAEGRFADFHGLRHTFITMVGKSGVSPKEHQDLARHSTYALTGRYTHSRFYDLAAAVQSLPIPTIGQDAEPQVLRATGTDGPNGQNSLGPFLGPQPAVLGDFLRLTETENEIREEQSIPRKQVISADFKGSEMRASKQRDTGVEPVSQPWEGWAQPIYQSRDSTTL